MKAIKNLVRNYFKKIRDEQIFKEFSQRTNNLNLTSHQAETIIFIHEKRKSGIEVLLNHNIVHSIFSWDYIITPNKIETLKEMGKSGFNFQETFSFQSEGKEKVFLNFINYLNKNVMHLQHTDEKSLNEFLTVLTDINSHLPPKEFEELFSTVKDRWPNNVFTDKTVAKFMANKIQEHATIWEVKKINEQIDQPIVQKLHHNKML